MPGLTFLSDKYSVSFLAKARLSPSWLVGPITAHSSRQQMLISRVQWSRAANHTVITYYRLNQTMFYYLQVWMHKVSLHDSNMNKKRLQSEYYIKTCHLAF